MLTDLDRIVVMFLSVPLTCRPQAQLQSGGRLRAGFISPGIHSWRGTLQSPTAFVGLYIIVVRNCINGQLNNSRQAPRSHP